MVVRLFRTIRQTVNLYYILCPVHRFQRSCSHIRFNWHVHSDAHVEWRSFGGRSSCRCRYHCRYMGASRTREGNGYFLSGSFDGSTSRPYHRWWLGHGIGLEKHNVVFDHLWRYVNMSPEALPLSNVQRASFLFSLFLPFPKRSIRTTSPPIEQLTKPTSMRQNDQVLLGPRPDSP